MRRILLSHTWPGNVRQLENALERAVLVCDGTLIRPEDLPRELGATGMAPPAPDASDLSIPRHAIDMEKALIRRALARHTGNKAAAARALELSYKALLYKIREYGIDG